MNLHRSRTAFGRARRSIPGGVNSPVRAFRAVGGHPILIRRGKGAWIEDLDGNRYLDYVGSWGPLILGHAHPAVVRAVVSSARRGTTYGAPTEAETELAELIRSGFPRMDRVRLVSSGTEACMSALRVARAFTKRAGVIKFEGCYHGHADPFLVKAGSGLATFGSPTSPGVEADHTIVLPYNDSAAFTRAMKRMGRKIAAVIVEPVAGNMGVVLPHFETDFLETLRRETRRHGALLIFDEVITGFRAQWGGAQHSFGIDPDLTTLGKVIGGGLPLAAFGGRRDVMKLLSPEGPVYQAGTLSGNPVAVAAGLAQLRQLKAHPDIYYRIDRLADLLAQALGDLGMTVERFGSMFTPFFQPFSGRDRWEPWSQAGAQQRLARRIYKLDPEEARPIEAPPGWKFEPSMMWGPMTNWSSVSTCDTKAYARFFKGMLKAGIYIPPSQFEAWFVGAAHTDSNIQQTIRAAASVLKSL